MITKVGNRILSHVQPFQDLGVCNSFQVRCLRAGLEYRLHPPLVQAVYRTGQLTKLNSSTSVTQTNLIWTTEKPIRPYHSYSSIILAFTFHSRFFTGWKSLGMAHAHLPESIISDVDPSRLSSQPPSLIWARWFRFDYFISLRRFKLLTAIGS